MDDVSTRMGPEPEFCDLPCELQLRVLSYLSLGELVLVARVSKALRRLAYDPWLWRTVTVREDMDDRWLQSALDRLSQLEALTLRRSPLVPAWAAHAARFPKLRLLDVGCSLDVNGAVLSHFVDGCPLLSHVNVEGCKGVDDATVEALCSLTGLVSVNVSHCCQVTDDGLLALARGCPRLVSLNADGISRITDRAVCGLAEHLGPQLVCLELDGELLTDASFKALRRCSRLETLFVSYTESLTDASLASIKELRTLRRLKLRASLQLTASGLGSLFREGSLGRLISLELDMELDDQALALLVKGCPLLQVLSLYSYGDITEVGLATIVNNCPNLESLVLPGPYEVQRLCLAGLVVSMPKLRHLHLDLIEMVDDPLLESLTRRLPHLRVYNSHGQLLVPLCESSGAPSLG
ncbi:F-box/LRR-repeat protein 20 isoform X3 [Ixodes scapularis]|nr:F-box/LRR-repeat protein 20 isoform X3 [Ixodes scapularis]